MKGGKWIIGGLIIGTFIVWLYVDGWAGPNGSPTESQMLAFWGRHFTFFSFLLGALNGHWLLGRKSAYYSSWFWPFLAILALLGWDILTLITQGWVEPWYRYAGLWFGLGLPAGSIFWPQQDPESPLP